ncbi:hypothetical protein AQUCO_00200269v1 [Aquilegia coerulea]|uniref:Endoglucanase n=1 Tax=Aquilegia coerulea TaxID=218851 RepID=A0A2G5F2F7_AQUCA|nr:hypothetical protein AQUCO_00200269v1 [Aquilegia coerulea]
MISTKYFGLGLVLLVLLIQRAASATNIDYGVALSKSLRYYQGQRSGKLLPTQSVQWRGDSGLRDGSDNGIDLVGGYYDAGDNVKFGFPMAYTITVLAWGVVEFEQKFSSKNELENALEAIKWGTDYIIKAHPQPNILYAQVGDGDSDHACWQRPEDMTTPRTSYKIDAQHPGSDLAAETSAALAASSIAFAKSNANYSSLLLTHAKQLFDFAKSSRGLYSDSIPVAQKFYKSRGDEDELLWAASWLYRATNNGSYMDYIGSVEDTGDIRTSFSWDDKYLGVQLFITKMVLEDKLAYDGNWADYRDSFEEFICNLVQEGSDNVKRSPGGLNWWQPWNNLQYTSAATLIATIYSKYLATAKTSIDCYGENIRPKDLVAFAKSQVDYILGSNPKNMSYMVGYGTNYPKQIHHRGASIVSIKKDPTPVNCQEGFANWYNKNADDPNVLDGAVVGGPSDTDEYTDARSNYEQSEPTLTNNAPLVGVLAKLV